jgi:hypothetical protein
MKRSFADILQGLDSDRAQKVARKLPAWAAVDGLEIPSALSLEQCSSSATAAYKANLAVSGGTEAGTAPATILDLTGGLGVDSWAFSQVAERVVYFERNAELAAAAGRNFTRLGAGNIEVRCEEVTPETELPEADLIYADPARRDAAGRKVFLLEDCTPDILTLLPMLLRKAPTVLLKLSPMADLAMLADRLGTALHEIHVVELDGEVKEILCLLHRDAASSEPEILITLLTSAATASENRSQQAGLSSNPLHPLLGGSCLPGQLRKREGPDDKVVGKGPAQPDVFGGSWPLREAERFRLSEEREAEVRFAAEVRPGDTLLEPCPALLKAGAFRLPCARWGLLKLAASTHLYLLPGANPTLSAPGNHFFKARTVLEVRPLGAAAFKTLRKSYPRAEVTARNLPLGSAELQKRLGVAPGGNVHIFGCRLADGASVLIVTEG